MCPSPDGPWQRYREALHRHGYQHDTAQERVVRALEACHQALAARQPTRGLYLWGPVGRGKTWLMDLFHRGLTVPSRRQHFHHFMHWVHRRLFQLSGQPDPLTRLAEELAREVRVLCFDELFVSDIGDAMLLGGLFQALFHRGLTLVVTSNQPPVELYADGFNRDRFLPAIHALTHHLTVLPVAGNRDYRTLDIPQWPHYLVADEPALQARFLRLEPDAVSTPLQLGGHALPVQGRGRRALWCRFADLCATPRAASDYMQLCAQFEQIFISGIPALGGTVQDARIARGTEDAVWRVAAGDRQLTALAAQDNSVRRFIALVDECYDQRRLLVLEAAVAAERLYEEGALLFPFQRTASRLQAMQRHDYLLHGREEAGSRSDAGPTSAAARARHPRP